MEKIAFIFPGQGAQYVGMGKEIYENYSAAKHIFEEASDALHMDMKKLCFEGPSEELVKTENTQPAILTTSISIMKVLEEKGLDCNYTAGLSLGEYASLVKAETFNFFDAVKLVKNRGRYMQEAVPIGVGTMAAILGLEKEDVLKCLEKSKKLGIVEVANYNCPGQIVISGEVEAVKSAVEECKKAGAKKAVLLPVSAPFHSSLLKKAGERLKVDLEDADILDPIKPVVVNVDAKLLHKRDEVIPNLVNQVSNSVHWEASMELMMQKGVDTFIEIGPGKSLTGFAKRVAKKNNKVITTLHVEDMETLEDTLKYFD